MKQPFIMFALALIAAFGVAIFVMGPDAEDSMNLSYRAQKRAELLGHMLIEQDFKREVYVPKSTLQDRGLASQNEGSKGSSDTISASPIDAAPDTELTTVQAYKGEVGFDPWGNPFQYELQGTNSKGAKLYLWSYGPNGTLDTDLAQLAKGIVSGDDIATEVIVK